LHGVSFLLVAANGALYAMGLALRAGAERRAAAAGAAACAIFALHTGYGVWAMGHFAPDKSGRGMDVAMVQPFSPLRVMNRDEETRRQIADTLTRMSLEVIRAGPKAPDVLLWPEGAAPFAPGTPAFNPEFMQRIVSIQAETSVPLIVQCVDFVTPPDSPRKRYYSSIAMIESSGATSGVYHKSVLMPLTEFLPFEAAFPALRRLFPNTRTVLRGDAGEPIAGPGGRFAPLICYEILFPKYVRQMVRQGCGYMVNLTNDLWYGRRQQPVQHLVFARLRAIENRKPVIRATNSGISALIDERGVTGEGRQTRSVEQTVLRGGVVPREGTTFYCRNGDILHRHVLPPVAALVFGFALWRSRRGLGKGPAR